ncbi:YbjN domain-containing protein [Zavarzinella formosa]|uniref:YbjN domain-containing protein n=1 Tax=Zavarzinella formosa TaxID=360055 RepID=UPI0002EA37CE|nr:YbjN domain-containing protein [Zavarzinella formosa]
MTGLFSTLIDYMEEENWKYEILEGETILRFHFKGTSGRLLCYAEVDEEKFWVIFYAYMPVNTPGEKMDEMAEFICRANRGMRIGNFELDYDDGEIRYKTSIDAEGGEMTHTMIDNLLRANLSTINRYFPGIMSVIYSDREVLDLIRDIEVPPASSDALDEDEDQTDEDDDEEIPFLPDADDEEDEDDGDDRTKPS